MSIQVIDQPTAASAIGSSLGHAVSNYLPKEVDRFRLQRGLENLRKENITDPYQLTAKLATTPGMDPGLLGILAPLLQSQIGRQQAGGGFGEEQGFQGQQQANAIGGGQPTQLGEPKLTPLAEGAPQVETLNELANNLLRHQPFNYQNIQAATAEAERRIANVESEFNKQTASFLQKGKELQEGEVGGDVLALMKQKAVQDLARTGKSERSMAQKYARQSKEIAKEYGAIRAVRNDTGLVNRANEGTIKTLRETAGRLSKLGVPEDQIIDNTKTNLGISRGAAEYIIDPLYGTKAGKAMHAAKESRGFEGIKNTFSSPEVKLAEKIAPLLTSADKIGSLAYIAEQKGLDSRKFIEELQRQLPQNIKDKLSTTQIRDLGNPYQLSPKMPPLKQIWLMGFSGEKKRASK